MSDARLARQGTIAAALPVKKFIPYGQFTEIDSRYYDPVVQQPAAEGFSRGRDLKPHGNNVNYQPAHVLIAGGPSISMIDGSLKVNYGTYIYDQVTGWDNAHPPDYITPVEPVFF